MIACKKMITLCTLLFVALSCSSKTDISGRSPGSSSQYLSLTIGEVDFLELVNEVKEKIDLGTDNEKYCSEEISKYYNIFLGLRSQDLNIDKFSKDDLASIVETSFLARLSLKEKLKKLIVTDADGRACLYAIEDIVRALRYVEDYMIELSYKRENVKEKFVTLSGKGIYYQINPEYASVFKGIKDLKSGDVILSRGNAYSSAAIARIGNNDNQFSHMSFVYRDEHKRLFTIEAHIEIGSVVAAFGKHIDERNARTVIFRYKDGALAHLAAKYMYEKVKKRNELNKNISYDFAMNYNSNDMLFCSEVVYDGFRYAGQKYYNKTIDIPKYKTKFNKGLITFLNNLGINVNKDNIDSFDTFGPADIQFDPDFDLVAEWRNPKKMSDTIMKDSILTSIFDWIEHRGYGFRPSTKTILKSKLSWMLRRTPFIKKKFDEMFPLNMTTKQLELFITLDQVGETLLNRLLSVAKTRKHSLSPIEMHYELEKYLAEDFLRYQKSKQGYGKDPEFHQYFNQD